MCVLLIVDSLRGSRVKNLYGPKKKIRGARGRETRDGESTLACLSFARVSRAPYTYIFHAPATQARLSNAIISADAAAIWNVERKFHRYAL